MGISSSNHFFVVLLALLSLTSANASRTLVKNDNSLKKTMIVDQKWSGGGGGGGPTCPGQGGNCPGQCQGSTNCPGQCQGSCPGCIGYNYGCVQYVPICQISCGCSQENPGRGYAYGNEKWKKIDDSHETQVHVVPTYEMMINRIARINSGVNNEAHVVKPKTIGEERTQSSSESINEEMTSKMNTMNNDVHKEGQVHIDSINGAMAHGVDMGTNVLHNEARVVTNGEPVKPNMETRTHMAHTVIGEDGTHETANEVLPPTNENEEP